MSAAKVATSAESPVEPSATALVSALLFSPFAYAARKPLIAAPTSGSSGTSQRYSPIAIRSYRVPGALGAGPVLNR